MTAKQWHRPTGFGKGSDARHDHRNATGVILGVIHDEIAPFGLKLGY